MYLLYSNVMFDTGRRCELIKLDGGSFGDDLACGFGEAFGLENVTASEIVQAAGRTLGDFYNSIYRFF